MFDQNLHFLHKKLRIHSRPDRNQSKLTVCTGQDQETTPTTPESSRKSTCFSRPVKKYLKIFVVREKSREMILLNLVVSNFFGAKNPSWNE